MKKLSVRAKHVLDYMGVTTKDQFLTKAGKDLKLWIGRWKGMGPVTATELAGWAGIKTQPWHRCPTCGAMIERKGKP